MRVIRLSLLSAALLATAGTTVRALPVGEADGPALHRRFHSGGWAFCPPIRRHHAFRYGGRTPRYASAEPVWLVSEPARVGRDTVVFPVCTPAGQCGPDVVVGYPRPMVWLPVSPITGQKLTTVYNSPASFPGAVDPEIAIVPLPHVRRAPFQGTYPSTY